MQVLYARHINNNYTVCLDNLEFFKKLSRQNVSSINLFINSDAILNRDTLRSIQSEKHYLQAVIIGGIHHTGKIL